MSTPARGRPPVGGAITASRLRDVAAQLFWSKGYGNTTIREIAEALDIQKASLYYHVDSKETLLYEICIESLNNIQDAVTAAVMEQDDPILRLRAMIRAHLHSLLHERYKHATMLTELKSFESERRQAIVAIRDEYETLIDSILLGAQGSGVLKPMPVEELRFCLLNMLNWSVFWYDPEGPISIDHLANSFSDLFLNGALIARTES